MNAIFMNTKTMEGMKADIEYDDDIDGPLDYAKCMDIFGFAIMVDEEMSDGCVELRSIQYG